MSYSSIYAAFESGDMEKQAEFRNGTLVTCIWDVVCRVYFNNAKFPWGRSDEGLLQKIWDLPYNPDIALKREHYYAHVATYDRAVVDPAGALMVADGFEATIKDQRDLSGNPNLSGQARFLRELATKKPRAIGGQARFLRELATKKPRAIGWVMTSCGDNLWWLPDGEYDGRPYNIDKDKGHFFIKPFEERLSKDLSK